MPLLNPEDGAVGPSPDGFHSDDAMWRRHPIYTNYEFSRLGQVRSLRQGRVRKTQAFCGYPYVTLYTNGKWKNIRVHRAVLETFVGPCPAGRVGCHLDGNRTNNALRNLAWVTQKENIAHKWAHGTMACGERVGHARLTERQVRAIRRRLAKGERPVRIAQRYGVARSTIVSIQIGRNWAWLS